MKELRMKLTIQNRKDGRILTTEDNGVFGTLETNTNGVIKIHDLGYLKPPSECALMFKGIVNFPEIVYLDIEEWITIDVTTDLIEVVEKELSPNEKLFR